jgi:hypothetical protein
VGAALGMAEPDPDPEQIRLKCIRKEGFFTVPAEHRVSRGASGAALAEGRTVALGVALQRRFRSAGTTVPAFPAAGVGSRLRTCCPASWAGGGVARNGGAGSGRGGAGRGGAGRGGAGRDQLWVRFLCFRTPFPRRALQERLGVDKSMPERRIGGSRSSPATRQLSFCLPALPKTLGREFCYCPFCVTGKVNLRALGDFYQGRQFVDCVF